MHAVSNHRGAAVSAPVADSATIGLWHMDEPGGDRVTDDGPLHLDATAGIDTRIDFGRFRSARVFSRSIESFLYVPYSPGLETSTGITVEAWIQPFSYGAQELTPIACRWTQQANEQSWLFGIVGFKLALSSIALTSPRYHSQLVQLGLPRHLIFALQPEEASLPLAYFSVAEVELKRWTHVAASYDGHAIRFYINGRLDSQYAWDGRIRPTRSPLLVGNYLDPHWLTDFADRLRVGSVVDRNPYYAFEGTIDELRISNVARETFEGAGVR